jgi:hypothetical protein
MSSLLKKQVKEIAHLPFEVMTVNGASEFDPVQQKVLPTKTFGLSF